MKCQTAEKTRSQESGASELLNWNQFSARPGTVFRPGPGTGTGMVKSAGNGNKPGTGIKPGTGMKPGTGIYLFGKSNLDSRYSKSMENCDSSMCKFTHATIQSFQKCCTGDRRLSMKSTI